MGNKRIINLAWLFFLLLAGWTHAQSYPGEAQSYPGQQAGQPPGQQAYGGYHGTGGQVAGPGYARQALPENPHYVAQAQYVRQRLAEEQAYAQDRYAAQQDQPVMFPSKIPSGRKVSYRRPRRIRQNQDPLADPPQATNPFDSGRQVDPFADPPVDELPEPDEGPGRLDEMFQGTDSTDGTDRNPERETKPDPFADPEPTPAKPEDRSDPSDARSNGELEIEYPSGVVRPERERTNRAYGVPKIQRRNENGQLQQDWGPQGLASPPPVPGYAPMVDRHSQPAPGYSNYPAYSDPAYSDSAYPSQGYPNYLQMNPGYQELQPPQHAYPNSPNAVPNYPATTYQQPGYPPNYSPNYSDSYPADTMQQPLQHPLAATQCNDCNVYNGVVSELPCGFRRSRRRPGLGLAQTDFNLENGDCSLPFYFSMFGGDTNLRDLKSNNDTLFVDNGPAVGLALGRRQGCNLRTELEFAYRTNKVIGTQSIGQPQTFQELDGDYTSYAGMANAYWEFVCFPRPCFKPYVGAGLGVVSVDASLNSPNGQNLLTGDSTDSSFAYQFMAGVNYKAYRDFDLFIEYRFFKTDAIRFDTAAGPQGSFGTESDDLFAGFRLKF